MRLLATATAAAGVIAGCLAIALAGQKLAVEHEITIATTDATLDAETEELARQAAEPDRTVEAKPVAESSAEGGPQPQQTGAYKRIAPRAPLSELGGAQRPKPKKLPEPDDWKATRLFNPVATSAGVLEAQGYRVALSGVQPTPPDEDCTYEGRAWPCGARARTAFRSWLRARAVQCVVPPAPDRELITAECNIGKEDLSAWLVASGWARPAENSPYGEIAEKARSAKLGIFGPPQNRVSLTLNPAQPAPLDAPSVEAAPEVAEPAIAPEPPVAGPFPPVPVAPAN